MGAKAGARLSIPATYKHKQTTIKEALSRIHRGGTIFLGSGCAEPLALSGGLIEYTHCFSDSTIIHILTPGEAAYTKPEFANNFRHNAFFIGANVRQAVQEGRADYTPIFLSEIPALFDSGRMPLDAALIQVTPPDSLGYCSLGVSVDIVQAAARNARLVIAQVNTMMPRTLGDSFIHMDDIHAFVEADQALPEWLSPAEDETAARIGEHIARMVKDGSTLQLGIGRIPDAVVRFLSEKNDLGIHTEMLSDGVMHLMQRGNINGTRKTLQPNAAVTSFCMGTHALYDWVNENPHVLFYPSDYVNDPGVIRQNDNMVAINSAIAVDLTGQVCADSIGSRFYSGIGGQVDFLRGSAKSRGGRPIIALPSTAHSHETGERISRIVAQLDEGAGVVTSRGDVHYIVTEYGVAYLHGKSIADRVRALVEVAHPDFRDELLAAAQNRHYIYGNPGQSTDSLHSYPAAYEHRELFRHPQQGEIEIFFRPIRPTDERRLQEFFYSHTDETIYRRYGYQLRSMPHAKAQELVRVNYQTRLAMVGVIGEPGDEQIIAIGRYELDETTHLAEVAFVVHEQYRNMGIASHLLTFLVKIIREKQFAGITAQVLAENTPMLHAFNDVLGPPDKSRSTSGETSLCYRFTPARPNVATSTTEVTKTNDETTSNDDAAGNGGAGSIAIEHGALQPAVR